MKKEDIKRLVSRAVSQEKLYKVCHLLKEASSTLDDLGFFCNYGLSREEQIAIQCLDHELVKLKEKIVKIPIKIQDDFNKFDESEE